MKLTDKACRNLKATSPEPRLADGGNLYLHALPGGTKSWRFRYRFAGKQKQIVLGTYPELSLAAARKARNELQALVDDGQDPSVVRHQEKVTKRAEALDSFELVAREWHREATSNRAPRYARQILERFERHVFKEFGAIPIKKVSALMVLDAIRKIEKTGALEMAHRVRIHVSDVFVWAISSGLAETDPAALIKKALKPREPELRPAMLTVLYTRAVRFHAGAELAELHRDLSATTDGQTRAEPQLLTAEDYRKHATAAIRDILGVPRTTVELI